MVVRLTVINISTCLDSICVVGTFGFAPEVFAYFCPSYLKGKDNVADAENGIAAEKTMETETHV